ncbi:sialidase-3-like [Pholidichthys leucotaenia]
MGSTTEENREGKVPRRSTPTYLNSRPQTMKIGHGGNGKDRGTTMGNQHSSYQAVGREKTTIFQSQKNEVYRIPALFYHRETETFLAFAEKRRTTNDASGLALVMKTGAVTRDKNAHQVHIQWSELRLVKEAHLDGYRPMNPCPLYDAATKKLYLFFMCIEGTVTEPWQLFWGINKGRVCYITSTDVGKSWSAVTDLTNSLPEIKNWAVFAVGPGHGLQSDSGRLIVPVYGYGSCNGSNCLFCGCSIPRAISLYSDDKGATWQFGDSFDKKSIECQMAEICDDKGLKFIYCNARNQGGYRVEAISHNDAEDFTIFQTQQLVETGNGCQGSVVSFPAQNEGANTEVVQSQDPKWLLYTHPADKCKRLNLGVYVNTFPKEPNSWSQPWILNPGPSAYSDLAYIDGGLFACLMERGEVTETEEIAFMIFSYDEVKLGIGKFVDIEGREAKLTNPTPYGDSINIVGPEGWSELQRVVKLDGVSGLMMPPRSPLQTVSGLVPVHPSFVGVSAIDEHSVDSERNAESGYGIDGEDDMEKEQKPDLPPSLAQPKPKLEEGARV